MAETRSSWLGDFTGFSLEETSMVSAPPDTGHVALTPLDLLVRLLAHMQVTHVLVVRQHLDRGDFKLAAERVCRSYPILAGRLVQQPPKPHVRVAGPDLGLPVSFATWPQGSARQFPIDYHYQSPLQYGEWDVAPPPYADGLNALEALHGNSPLFALRMTHLGDGNSLVAATWVHYVADGNGMAKILNALAAAYRGDHSSRWLPEPCLHTGLWPEDLAKLDAKPSAPDSEAPAADDSAASTTAPVHVSENMLADGPFSIGAHADQEQLHGAMFNQLLKNPPQTLHLVTVHLAQADLAALKESISRHHAVAELPYITSNDIVAGLTWLLECEHQHLPLPGQGPAGTQRKLEFTAALPLNGLPAEAVAPGHIGNCMAAFFPVITADGSRQQIDDTDREGLELSLALAVAVVRKEILALRKPGAAVKAVLDTAALVTTQGYQMLLDSVGTQPLDGGVASWGTFENDTDFGIGETCLLNGHTDWLPYRGACLIKHSDGAGIRMLCNTEGVDRIRNSIVLQHLAPASGML